MGRLLAKYRPKCPILAVTASESVCRQLCSVRGVVPMLTASFVGTDSVIQKAVARAKEEKLVMPGQSVVAVHGQREEVSGASNLLKVVVVPCPRAVPSLTVSVATVAHVIGLRF